MKLIRPIDGSKKSGCATRIFRKISRRDFRFRGGQAGKEIKLDSINLKENELKTLDAIKEKHTFM